MAITACALTVLAPLPIVLTGRGAFSNRRLLAASRFCFGKRLGPPVRAIVVLLVLTSHQRARFTIRRRPHAAQRDETVQLGAGRASSADRSSTSTIVVSAAGGTSMAAPLEENRIGIDCLRRFLDRSGSESELSWEAVVSVLLCVVAAFRNEDESVRLDAFSVELWELLVCDEFEASLSTASSPLSSGGGVA
uniref:KIND domain-containing protein n=1 Tax=Anopheles melas TaxID=34690 RepID=A0A182UF28_9DIPT